MNFVEEQDYKICTWKDWLQYKRSRCQIYTRIMWYFRPVSSFNAWKKSEFYQRKNYKPNI